MAEYSDIDFDLLKHPNTGDIIVKKGPRAIIGAIRNLILTGKYERPFSGVVYSTIRNQLFEPVTPLNAFIIKKEIVKVIEENEPRAVLQNVQVFAMPDASSYNVNIYFRMVNHPDVSKVTVQLERLR
jgi:hypothetical protein